MNKAFFPALAFIVGIGVSLTSCVTTGTATAKVSSIETFESRLGIINVPQFTIGTVFWIDRKTKQSGPVNIISYTKDDLVYAAKKDKDRISYDSKMEVSFSANIPVGAQGGLATAIQKSTNLEAENLQRISMKDAITRLNSLKDKKSIVDFISHNPQADIFIVFAVMEASKFVLSVENSASSGANVSIVRYGNYELSVSYNAASLLEMAGKGVPVFFKIAALGYDAKNDKFFFDSTKDTSMIDINLNAAK